LTCICQCILLLIKGKIKQDYLSGAINCQQFDTEWAK